MCLHMLTIRTVIATSTYTCISYSPISSCNFSRIPHYKYSCSGGDLTEVTTNVRQHLRCGPGRSKNIYQLTVTNIFRINSKPQTALAPHLCMSLIPYFHLDKCLVFICTAPQNADTRPSQVALLVYGFSRRYSGHLAILTTHVNLRYAERRSTKWSSKKI